MYDLKISEEVSAQDFEVLWCLRARRAWRMLRLKLC